jgi:hypothetical protein
MIKLTVVQQITNPAKKKKQKSYFFNVNLEPCGELEEAQPLFCRSADYTEGYMFIKFFV